MPGNSARHMCECSQIVRQSNFYMCFDYRWVVYGKSSKLQEKSAGRYSFLGIMDSRSFHKFYSHLRVQYALGLAQPIRPRINPRINQRAQRFEKCISPRFPPVCSIAFLCVLLLSGPCPASAVDTPVNVFFFCMAAFCRFYCRFYCRFWLPLLVAVLQGQIPGDNLNDGFLNS